MILEGIVTSVGIDGLLNIAPMGPRVESGMKRLLLRPFKSSQTYQNLKAHGEGVFHVTDDVLLLAQAAVGAIDPPPFTVPATKVNGHILQEACRFYEFRVRHIDDSQDRTEIEALVLASGRQRDFFGFNRAKHAVVEAAILVTRLHLLPWEAIEADLQRLAVLVEKTGGEQEWRAFEFLRSYAASAPSAPRPGAPAGDLP
jgi:hypothetical protein